MKSHTRNLSNFVTPALCLFSCLFLSGCNADVIYYTGFNGISDWAATSTDIAVKGGENSLCSDLNSGAEDWCASVPNGESMSISVSTLGFKGIRVEFGVLPYDLKSDQHCFVRYETSTLDPVTQNVAINGSDPHYVLDIAHIDKYDDQTGFTVTLGTTYQDPSNCCSLPPNDPICYFDNFEVTGTVITQAPTGIPTLSPTKTPSNDPTLTPTKTPTSMPTVAPTRVSTTSPTKQPTVVPLSVHTDAPTDVPVSSPTFIPAPTNKDPTSTPTPALTSSTTPTMTPSESQQKSSNQESDTMLFGLPFGVVLGCMIGLLLCLCFGFCVAFQCFRNKTPKQREQIPDNEIVNSALTPKSHSKQANGRIGNGQRSKQEQTNLMVMQMTSALNVEASHSNFDTDHKARVHRSVEDQLDDDMVVINDIAMRNSLSNAITKGNDESLDIGNASEEHDEDEKDEIEESDDDVVHDMVTLR